MGTTERVTVTLSAELVEGIDRLERNRSRFIAEAVERELSRRRRDALLLSIGSPHAETTALADVGLGDWTADLPDVRDSSIWQEGPPFAGSKDKAGSRNQREARSRHVVLVELDPTVGHEQRGVRPCVAGGAAHGCVTRRRQCRLIPESTDPPT